MENPPVLDGWSYEIRVKLIAMMVYQETIMVFHLKSPDHDRNSPLGPQ